MDAFYPVVECNPKAFKIQKSNFVKMKKLTLTCLAFLLCIGFLLAQERANSNTETNVVYGMHGGLALLMDVYRPENSNGFGVVVIPGSGWHQPLSYDARPLNQNPWYLSNILGIEVLLENGYTLFIINHRSAPVFHYPAAVEDAQRAVQFIRHKAKHFKIDPERMGAVGHSSGGHLVDMLGTLNDIQKVNSESPIEQHSSRVQAVVSLSSPTDLYQFVTGKEGDSGAVSSFLGAHYLAFWGPNYPVNHEKSLFIEASPITHVTADDPPFLIVHGDKDSIVPYSQAEIFEETLIENNVSTQLIKVGGGNHIFYDGNSEKIMNNIYFEEMVNLFELHLLNGK